MNSSKRTISYLQKCYLRQFSFLHRDYSKAVSQQNPEEASTEPVYQYATENTRKKKRIYMWGNAKLGALGNASFIIQNNPKNLVEDRRYPCRLSFDLNHTVRDIACGYGFTVFAASNEENDFSLFGTGLNSDFQIGYHCKKKNRPLEILAQPVPIALPVFKMSSKAIKVACGRAHTIVLTDEEGVFSLGNNSYGQCGVPEEFNAKENSILKVHKIEGVEDIKEVFCGQDHTMLLSSNGKVYSFGWGADGQTGVGHYNCQFTPTLVKGDIENENIVQLSCAADCVLAVSDKGDVFGWGNSEYKQLVSATDKQQIHTPKFLKLNVGKVKQVASGGTMCAALNDQGQVYVWGYGILGQGPYVTSSPVPTLLPEPLFGINEFSDDLAVEQISCGLSHFGAITNKGHLYMWGKNRSNCLGLPKENDQFFPLKVAVPAEVLKVSCGVDHTAVLCRSFA